MKAQTRIIKMQNSPPRERKERRAAIKDRVVFKGSTKLADRRVSVCTDCRKGIFEDHKYLWTRRGLVHQWCEDEKKDEVKVTA